MFKVESTYSSPVACTTCTSGFLRIRKALAEYPEVRFSIEEAQGGIWAVFDKAIQVGIEGVKVESLAEKVLALLVEAALSKRQIAEALGYQAVFGQLHETMRQLLRAGKVELTLPAKPNSRLQKYRLKPHD